MRIASFALSLGLLSAVIPSLVAPALPPDAMWLREANAQTGAGSIIGQCRMSNRVISVFAQASVAGDSAVVATLEANTRVTLASNGAGGWIEIREPVAGFVISRYLTTCPEPAEDLPFKQHSTLTNLAPGACRRAVEDLAIRPEPRRDARPFLGSIKAGETMILTGESQMGDEYRLWLRISQPIAGWVSGGVEGGTNVDFCG